MRRWISWDRHASRCEARAGGGEDSRAQRCAGRRAAKRAEGHAARSRRPGTSGGDGHARLAGRRLGREGWAASRSGQAIGAGRRWTGSSPFASGGGHDRRRRRSPPSPTPNCAAEIDSRQPGARRPSPRRATRRSAARVPRRCVPPVPRDGRDQRPLDPRVIERATLHYDLVRVDNDRDPDVNRRYNMVGWPITAFHRRGRGHHRAPTYRRTTTARRLENVRAYADERLDEVAAPRQRGRSAPGGYAA